jgi:hypothetical protein
VRRDRASCIASELLADLSSRPAQVLLLGFCSLLYPALMGMADGGISHVPGLAADGLGLRHSMVTAMLGPASMVLVIVTELLFPRKLRRELEPFLAAPVTSSEIVLGWALVPAAAATLYVVAAFPLCELGFGVISRSPLTHLGADVIAFTLSTAVSTVWVLAGSLDALFKAAGPAEFTLRMIPAWILLLAIEGARQSLRFLGYPRAAAAALFAGLILGLCALALVARRLDREDLIQRI